MTINHYLRRSKGAGSASWPAWLLHYIPELQVLWGCFNRSTPYIPPTPHTTIARWQKIRQSNLSGYKEIDWPRNQGSNSRPFHPKAVLSQMVRLTLLGSVNSASNQSNGPINLALNWQQRLNSEFIISNIRLIQLADCQRI